MGRTVVAVYDPFLPLGHRRAPYIKDTVVMRIPEVRDRLIKLTKLERRPWAHPRSFKLLRIWSGGRAVADAKVAAVREGCSDEADRFP